MHDIKFIRTAPDAFDAGLARRGLPAQSAAILALDSAKRAAQTELQELQSKRNTLAKQIGMAKGKGENADALMDEAKRVNESFAALESTLNTRGEMEALLETIPNLPAADVPQGADEKGNKEIRQSGKKPEFSFAPKEHFDLGEGLKMMDFEGGAKLSGARFVVLKGQLARLERALAGFFLDNNIAAGYTEIVPPFITGYNAMHGTGQMPKFKSDLFIAGRYDDILDWVRNVQADPTLLDASNLDRSVIKGFTDFWLIPTAEVPLTNLVADSILDEETLPIRMTAYTPCFRSEAGSAGKDTRGMIRQHQFSKVEMVSITHPDASQAEHERMTAQAESLLQKLGLHFRTMLLCTGDMGFSSEKTYDIEVWLPGQNAFREISSCSNCGAFQARRMKARFKGKNSKETQFVHTLNGSGLPIGRTMVAILENYQNADGSVTIPEALRPYMDGQTVIAAGG